MSSSDEASMPSKGEFWVKKWQEGQTKWDLGQPTPALCEFLENWKSQRHLSAVENASSDGDAAKGQPLDKNANKMFKVDSKELEVLFNDRSLAEFPMAKDVSKKSPVYALVPGCGSGYDVCLLAAHGWQTTGLDISPIAVSRAKLLASSTENADLVDFKLADFFEYEPPNGGFHLIFDYT
ncbi:hypothetical protein H4R34_006067 [Dimargaris verticillata]|uniref:S-adenosyl-L-methionine-dependent methyltransferase n=1 Tax=Dimargaris verticillata TaxID=2761393 RepID=A0A9W8E5I6_9FUNG|nr:hypothetical protein H4R34_006067 [Dimargaris verticillata]